MASTAPRISWKIEEYTHREKSSDWYWALGVVAVAGAAIAIIYNNMLFGIFILLAALILGAYAKRPPEILDVAISESGITVQEYLYPFDKISGFAVDKHELGSYLLIETNRFLVPVMAIPLPESIEAEALTDLLRTKVTEKKLKEPTSHKLMEYLGF